MIEAEGRQGEFQGSEKVRPRKEDAEQKLGKKTEHGAPEGKDEPDKKIVQSAAEQPQKQGAEKGGKVAH